MRNFVNKTEPLKRGIQNIPMQQKTVSAIPVPVAHPVKGTPVHAIGLIAASMNNGILSGSNTSIEQRKGIIRKK
jgi:hypothetical protein